MTPAGSGSAAASALSLPKCYLILVILILHTNITFHIDMIDGAIFGFYHNVHVMNNSIINNGLNVNLIWRETFLVKVHFRGTTLIEEFFYLIVNY